MNVGTFANLGRVDGMPSVPSIARFIAARPDFPVIQHGRYGKPFALDAAAAIIRKHWRDGRHERRLRRLAAAEGDGVWRAATLAGAVSARRTGAVVRMISAVRLEAPGVRPTVGDLRAQGAR
ncbi:MULTISPECIES: hypothetical protein [unclassified Sphingomonas]|uniref:hypothetical protein n=1 Tax=unclassified Sphingomonas TaxID=196159 RepID=UPI00226A8024|nr:MULTISPECIES: hypothetical protein [unclassified Sphingomonas]